mmetsp:Transcript_1191/g.1934  ORF Transcript_1191/g.1934 Transcript_1191/m.1934 type:complete len:373 (-) Transcript_1191:134-1252(-)|eukprot:CAMPEP_0185022044 /NCGR_PEP_ID=MMETSP1103-20130426/4773_1 /TAXON_ID=36769 /ORGANISM="Paraphysomonas bandaiensis, Strain Caron Lab Isolate" /LENGTH=372 /DNA_ID=CAMNT_0027553941 /DNA_START=33 /DNA_END=1151 /DNA_ORIENTATION=-
MSSSPTLTRAERLKLWQALKQSKKAENATSVPSNTRTNQNKRTRRKMKYFDSSQCTFKKTQSYTGTPCVTTTTHKSCKLQRHETENNNPNERRHTESNLTKDFNELSISHDRSDEGSQSSTQSTPQYKSETSRRSSIIEGYVTANDDFSPENTPVRCKKLKSEYTDNRAQYDAATPDEETINLRRRLTELEEQNMSLHGALTQTQKAMSQSLESAKMSLEENQSWAFMNDILCQRVAELESTLNLNRMHTSEKEYNKTAKHKEEIKKLKSKNEEYESRANAMVEEMSARMSQLQEYAMKRIEQLESELLVEKHKSETLEETVRRLQMQLSSTTAEVRRARDRRTSSLCSIESMDPESDDTQDMYSDDDADIA